MNSPLFITGIGTAVGKTVISAVLSQALQADYWKPIQCGDLDSLDSSFVKSMLTNSKSVIHPERHKLKAALSPHAAAEREGLRVSIQDFVLPKTQNRLIIEGAGGLMVPLNSEELVIDLIQRFRAKVILVSRNYLGSINHTLLSIEAIRHRGLELLGVIFNGEPTPQSEELILSFSKVPLLGKIPWQSKLSPSEISHFGQGINLESL